MSSQNYFSEARKRKSQELLLVLGSEPRCRVRNEWVRMGESPVLLTEWNHVLKSLLKAEQIQRLEKEGLLQGCVQMADGFRTSYEIFQSQDCFKAYFSFEPLEAFKTELSLPAAFLETVQRRQGLILLTGPADSSKTVTLAQTLYRLNKDQAFHAAVHSRHAFPSIPEEKASFVYQSTPASGACDEGFYAGADVVVLHETLTPEGLQQALDLCEEGKMVFLSIASNSLMSALHKCLGFLNRETGGHSLWRFADHLKVSLSQHALLSLTQESIFAFEMVLSTPQVRSWIAHGNLAAVEGLLTSSDDVSGALGLNQSLLQLLIRRRIDIKQAFLASHDPNSLDQLLKKVGL